MENRDTIRDIDVDCPWSNLEDEPVLPPTDMHRHLASLLLPGLLLLGKTLGTALSHGVLALTAWPRRAIAAHHWYRARKREQRIFENMTDSMLKDIGLTRCDLYDDLYQRYRRNR